MSTEPAAAFEVAEIKLKILSWTREIYDELRPKLADLKSNSTGKNKESKSIIPNSVACFSLPLAFRGGGRGGD